jgi:hypothetical protein
MENAIKILTTGITLFMQAVILTFVTAFAFIGIGLHTIFSKLITKSENK